MQQVRRGSMDVSNSRMLSAHNASFITVVISSIVPEWISLGDYDSKFAHLLAQTGSAALKKVSAGSPLKDDRRRRGDRFLRQKQKMGCRVPWRDDAGNNIAGTEEYDSFYPFAWRDSQKHRHCPFNREKRSTRV